MSNIKEFNVSTSNHKNYKVMIEEYNSASDVVKDCNTRNITNSSFENKRTCSMSRGWEGVSSYDEALGLLKNGYIDKVGQIKLDIAKSYSGNSKRISFNNDVVGFAPVVPLALLGVPTSMINSTIKPIKAKVINIYYDITCSSGTKCEDIIQAGIELLKAIMSLEKQGYRINLNAVQTYTGYSSVDILKLNLKSANQPLDLKRISFPTMHTAFFRVIGFDWYSKTPKGTYRSGYGHPLVREFYDDERIDFVTKAFGKNSVYISASSILYEKNNKIEEVIKDESTRISKSN